MQILAYLRHVNRLFPVLLALPLAAASASAQVTAIRAGQLIDPERGTVARDQVILVEKGKITAVGAGLTVPAGATVVDLSSATVLPGLFDMHTHLCMVVRTPRDAHNYFYTTLRDPNSLRAVEGVVNAKAMLESGFTSVRDVGNEGNYACVSVKLAIDAGLIPGPTMQTAGRIIAPFGGQFQLQPERRELGEPEYFFADTRDEMVKAVRENAHFGATVIKIVVDDQPYIYSVDDIRFIKEEAARAGLKLAAHCWTHAGAANAAAAGVASIEHGFSMTNEDLQLARKNGVVLVGTEFPAKLSEWMGIDWHPQWVDRLKRAAQIGVTMAFGTDVIDDVPGETRGTLAMSYVESWIEAGVPPKTLLQAMTINAARLMGVDQERGMIRPGMAADIIATAGNPLDDPVALKQVSFVMKNGQIIRQH